MNDKIADMLIRLKNAGAVEKASVSMPYSRLNLEILNLLEKSGFISAVAARENKESKIPRYIDVSLSYVGSRPRIRGAERVSKLSRRVYKSARDMRPVKNGYGMMVISTPKGLMTDMEARKEKVGGEALFTIW